MINKIMSIFFKRFFTLIDNQINKIQVISLRNKIKHFIVLSLILMHSYNLSDKMEGIT